MKLCSGCHHEKPKLEFSADKSKKDGLRTRCKNCCSIAKKGHRLKRIRTTGRKQNRPLGSDGVAEFLRAYKAA